jgi:hypothetical protein
LGQAIAWNVLTVLALPFLLVWFGRLGVAALRGKPVQRRPVPARLVLAILGVILVFWVLRNLPPAPCNLLAPHRL